MDVIEKSDTAPAAESGRGLRARLHLPVHPPREPLWARIAEAGGPYPFFQQWLTGERHGRYGFATIRIGIGVILFLYLLVNVSVAPRIWGPGSAWMGSSIRQDNLWPWPISLAQDAAADSFWFSAWYLLLWACSVTLILGWRTRITIPLTYVLFTGLIGLNPVVTDNGDLTCRLLLIYLTFADASGVWSLDARRRRRRRPGKDVATRRRTAARTELATIVHNFALIIVVANLCLIYFTAGLLKLQEPLWREGTAVYYPLAIGMYQPWPALSELAWGTDLGVKLVTYGSIVIQLSFPFLILFRATRWIALIAAIGLHGGIALLMGLPFFSGFMASMDAIIISTTAYLWFEGRLRHLRDWLLTKVGRQPADGG